MDAPHEQRSTPRKVPLHSLRVTDAETGEELGWVIDITQGGMRLFTVGDRPTGKQFRLRIELPVTEGFKSTLEIESRSIWYLPDDVTGRAQLGIEFTETLDVDKSQILSDLVYRHCA